MQEDLNQAHEQNLRLQSNTVLEAARESFNLATEMLKVIKKMLETSGGSPVGQSNRTIELTPRRFAGTDLIYYALWRAEVVSYICNRWICFEDCAIVRLVVLSFPTDQAANIAHKHLPLNFTYNAKNRDTKENTLWIILEWLDDMYEDYLADQRAIQDLENYFQKESDEIQPSFLVCDDLLHMAGKKTAAYRGVGDLEHQRKRIRPQLRNPHAIRKVFVEEPKTISNLPSKAAHWESQVSRGSGGGQLAIEQSGPTHKEHEVVQRQLKEALEKKM
jgi:hypothetical protein